MPLMCITSFPAFSQISYWMAPTARPSKLDPPSPSSGGCRMRRAGSSSTLPQSERSRLCPILLALQALKPDSQLMQALPARGCWQITLRSSSTGKPRAWQQAAMSSNCRSMTGQYKAPWSNCGRYFHASTTSAALGPSNLFAKRISFVCPYLLAAV